MIFLNEQSLGVIIPKHQLILETDFTLKLVHTLTKELFEFENLENSSMQDKLYLFECDFSKLIDGTYVYFLYAENEIIEEGLLVYGNFESEVKEYEKNNTTVSYNG